MKKSHEVRCALCNDCGLATVWHSIGVDAWRDGTYERRRHMLSMAVACSCRAGERYRGGHVNFSPSQHCPYPTLEDRDEMTLAEKREMVLQVWVEDHFGNTSELVNGIQMETRY